MRRLSLVLLISVCLHLLVLAVRFRREGVVAPGHGQPVRLSADRVANFVPQRREIDSAAAEQIPPRVLSVGKRASGSVVSSKPVMPLPAAIAVGQMPVEKQPVDEAPNTQALEVPVLPQRENQRESGWLADSSSLKSDQAEPKATSASLAPTVARQVEKVSGLQPSAQLSHRTSAMPLYADNPKPVYPDVARRRGWDGVVELRVEVGVDGRVAELALERSSGYAVLDRAARRAVRRWRFVPAREADIAVRSEVVVPINFRLPEKELSKTETAK